MADKRKLQKTESAQPIPSGSVQVGGNAEKSVIVTGDGNVVHYYAANGEKREMRTGWFYGHRYGDLATFTGRETELKMLDDWLNNDKDNLLMLRALGAVWQIRAGVDVVQPRGPREMADGGLVVVL